MAHGVARGNPYVVLIWTLVFMKDLFDDTDVIHIIVVKRRRRSPSVTPEMVLKIRKLRGDGWMQHDIAAQLGINQGRVSEVLNNKR